MLDYHRVDTQETCSEMESLEVESDNAKPISINKICFALFYSILLVELILKLSPFILLFVQPLSSIINANYVGWLSFCKFDIPFKSLVGMWVPAH